MIISRTPLRISFFGGGTDYPQWYNTREGAVLGTSIDKYCYVMIHDGKSWFTFDLPNKSGLGSSSAYTVGLLRVCTDLDKITIAKLATTWEQDKMNGNVGSQDQYLCALGGFHYLKFSEHGVRDIPFQNGSGLQDYLMLFDTHQYRMGSLLIADQLERIEQNEVFLTEMRALVDDGLSALESGDYIQFGKLFGRNWHLKKQLAKSVTTPVIDAIYELAIQAGAIGGKLCGGGGGGFITFVVEPEKQETVRNTLKELTYVPFKFENEGTQIIYRDVK